MANPITRWSAQEEGAIREQLSTVLASAFFVRAERLGRFLKFVVEETLDGRADRLNQYLIAIDVFDRDETFDPAIPWGVDAAGCPGVVLLMMLGAT